MGGGDLNLKKSWHPSTFANLEKVWKAEQRDDSERKKIAQLQQELKEERAREDMHKSAIDAGVIKQKDNRVDWLYSGPASSVNREEYLLGKKIDKLVDPTVAEAEREKEALSSGPGALFVGSATGGTDLAMKIREDPLFLIKQKEEEAKKKLASNPIKIKQLQQLLEAEKKGHKAGSSHKKKRKHKRSREDHSKSPPRSRRDHSPSDSPPSRSRHHHSDSQHDSSRKQNPRTNIAPVSRPSSRYQPYSKPPSRSKTRGMDPEELERRRQEMMASAKDHDKEREKRLRRHEQEVLKNKDSSLKEKAGFLEPLRVKSLSSSGSLADRIHRNINSVQRTAAKLDSNFMSK